MRNYGVIERKDLIENIYDTLDEVFKNISAVYDYAVIYYEHKDEAISKPTEIYGQPCLINTHEINDYGCIDFYKDQYDALYRWREIPKITNKNYHRVAVVCYSEMRVIIEEDE